MMAEYPRTNQSIKLMMPDELEAHLKKLARYHIVRYAGERMADGLEINGTILAEYAVDSMHEDDGCSEKVYNWIGDDAHWCHKIATEVADKFNS